jgi:single-stranded-DNA-specific exonuclease
MQTFLGNQIFIQNTNISSLEDILCSNRGVSLNPEEKKEFFEPDFSMLHDPFLIPDMEKAVNRILLAKERGEIVAIS